MFTLVSACLPLFPRAYLGLLVFNYVCQFARAFLCLPQFTRACLPIFTPVYSCLPAFTYV